MRLNFTWNEENYFFICHVPKEIIQNKNVCLYDFIKPYLYIT